MFHYFQVKNSSFWADFTQKIKNKNCTTKQKLEKSA